MSKEFFKTVGKAKKVPENVKDGKDLSLFFFRTEVSGVYRFSNYYILGKKKASKRIFSKVTSLAKAINAINNYCKDNAIEPPWYKGYVNYVHDSRIKDVARMLEDLEGCMAYRPSSIIQIEYYKGVSGAATSSIHKLGKVLDAKTTHAYMLPEPMKGSLIKQRLGGHSKLKSRLVFNLSPTEVMDLLDVEYKEISLEKFKYREELPWKLI